MIEPEHIKSIALKNAWVQMCRNARCGWFIPSVTIIRPSWLDVEKAMIFLMSFWVRAQIAVNNVVRAPRQSIVVKIKLLLVVRGGIGPVGKFLQLLLYLSVVVLKLV